MFGSNFLGSASLSIFGSLLGFGEIFHRVLLGFAFTLGTFVIASFIITRLLRRMTK